MSAPSDYQALPAGLPVPEDDGACNHLRGRPLPPVMLPSTDSMGMALSDLPGLCVLYFYPMTGTPGVPLPEGWDMIPGARGCTPQACAFRDHFAELQELGVEMVFGISTQSPQEQAEAAERLHLPFPLLSDERLALSETLRLPTFEVEGRQLIRRLTLITRDGVIERVFYPVFPPDRNAQDVLEALRGGTAAPGN